MKIRKRGYPLYLSWEQFDSLQFAAEKIVRTDCPIQSLEQAVEYLALEYIIAKGSARGTLGKTDEVLVSLSESV